MATTERKMLGQAVGVTAGASIYTPAAGVKTIIESIVICNVTGGAVTYSIYLDDDGTDKTAAEALYEGVSLAANTTVRLGVQLAMANASGNLTVKASVATSLTFTVFGTETSN